MQVRLRDCLLFSHFSRALTGGAEGGFQLIYSWLAAALKQSAVPSSPSADRDLEGRRSIQDPKADPSTLGIFHAVARPSRQEKYVRQQHVLLYVPAKSG